MLFLLRRFSFMKRGQASKPNWLYMMMIWFCSSWKERSFFYQKSVSTSPSNLTCMEKNFTYSVAFPLELELGADIWARRAPLKSTDGDGPWLPQLFFSCLAPQSPSPHKEPFFWRISSKVTLTLHSSKGQIVFFNNNCWSSEIVEGLCDGAHSFWQKHSTILLVNNGYLKKF